MQCFLFFASVCPCPWCHVPCLSSIWLAGIQRGKAANNLIAQSHLKLLLKELVDTDVVVVDVDTDTDMDMTTNLQTQRQVNQVVAVALLIGSLSGHGRGGAAAKAQCGSFCLSVLSSLQTLVSAWLKMLQQSRSTTSSSSCFCFSCLKPGNLPIK